MESEEGGVVGLACGGLDFLVNVLLDFLCYCLVYCLVMVYQALVVHVQQGCDRSQLCIYL